MQQQYGVQPPPFDADLAAGLDNYFEFKKSSTWPTSVAAQGDVATLVLQLILRVILFVVVASVVISGVLIAIMAALFFVLVPDDTKNPPVIRRDY